MSIFYKLRFKSNKKHPEYNGYYATIANKGLVRTDEIADEIQRNCSMKRSDVIAVLAELSEVMKHQIQQSHSVKLDGLGVFRPGISSSIADKLENFNPATNIKGLRLNFTGESFKQGRKRIKNVFAGAKIVQETVPAVTKVPDPGHETEGGKGGGNL